MDIDNDIGLMTDVNAIHYSGDLNKVKELLGHSSVTTTEVYLRFPRGYLEEIFNKQHIGE